MDEFSVNIKEFINQEWREMDNNALVHASRSEDFELADVPTFIVGIGGTGVAAARKVKEKVDQHYHPHVAERLEYLFIDTDPASVAGLKGSDTLVIQSADTAILLREYKEKGPNGNLTLAPEITEWLDPEISPFRVMNGAAGIRQAGRLILFLNINRVYQALKQKLDKISVNYDLQKTRIKVHIFTGIGGGTGSGMFVDISYLIRHIRSNCELQGFIFMPDVSCLKPGLHEVHRRNIKRNAFAALMEIEQLMTLEMYKETFEQSYPGKLAHITSSFPIFEFCVLVGSMQDGRKAMSSEEEIFDHVAEYLLLELSQKESGTYDFESLKSNLCVEPNREFYFSRYASIDADAKYLPLDYYYSWWLKDVFQLICTGLEANPLTTGDNGIIQKTLANRNSFYEKLKGTFHLICIPPTRKRIISSIHKDLKADYKKDLTLINTVEAKLNLLGSGHSDSNAPDNMDKLLAQMEIIPKNFPFLNVKRRHFAKYYKVAFTMDESYKSILDGITKYATEFSLLMQEIYYKCCKYADTKLQDSAFDFAMQAFQKLQVQDNYKKSLRDAASKIIDDFLREPELWLGKREFPHSGHLSDYVATLVSDNFEKSGCTSIYNLLKRSSGSGVSAIQENFEQQVLEKLHAAQLWPIRSGVSASTLQHYNAMNLLAHSNKDLIPEWVKTWAKSATEQISDFPNQMHDRVAMAIYASGYALRHYEGANELEWAYENAANRAGLRLFAGERASWNRPFSPLFSYDWDNQTTSNNQRDAHKYREVFDRAMKTVSNTGTTLIYYDNVERKYVCRLSAEQCPIPIGNIEGNEGDIRHLATEIFIRMRDLRKAVEKALDECIQSEEHRDGT